MSNNGGPTDLSFYDPFNPSGFAGEYALGTHPSKDDKKNQGTINTLTQNTRDKNREGARQNIIGDRSLDEASRQELLKMFDSGKKTYEILARLNDAKKGVGVFGINQKNSELLKQLTDQPGRQQVILTQGAKEVSGTESTGLLTGIKK